MARKEAAKKDKKMNPLKPKPVSKGKKRPRSKKPPKIFLTRLPLNELQDPEIFFTKIIKEEDSSVKILPSDLGPDQLEALAQSPSLMFEEVVVNV